MLNLHQKQSLQQKLSPQQIQYIKLLQLPTLALEQRIKAEMEINPLLEQGADEDELMEREQADDLDDHRGEADNADADYDWEERLNTADELYGCKTHEDS